MRDLKIGYRHLLQNRSSTLVAIVTLAIGIGATTALFSVIYGVVLSPYPYSKPHEIWTPGLRATASSQLMRPYRFSEFEAMSRLPSFASVMATSPGGALLTGEFAPEPITAIRVSANAFQFLAVPPVLGRAIQPSDVSAEGLAQPVVVLSYARWQRQFGSDPDVLGKTLVLDSVRYAIVGVMPSRFGWWTSDGVWLPLGRERLDATVFPIVRLARDVSADAAQDQLHTLQLQFKTSNPAGFPRDEFSTTLTNYLDITVASGQMTNSLRLLFGAVVFLLLIACTNVANLQLARASVRTREIGVRLALGATRRQLIRQLLSESVLLALVGGLAGLAVAYGITLLMVGLMPPAFVPNEARIELNGFALAFCFLVSVATGIVFGMFPAFQSSRPQLSTVLNDESRGSSAVSGARLRGGLVIAEVAIAVTLLAGAAVTLRSFNALQNVELGFRPQQVMTLQLPLPPARYSTADARNRFAQDVVSRVRRLPGVEAVAIGNGGLPFGGPQSAYTLIGQPRSDAHIRMHLTNEDYVRVLGMPLRSGRMLSERDVQFAEHNAVINEAAAALWPSGTNPIGQRMILDLLEPPPSTPLLVGGTPSREVTVVGVIANARNDGLEASPQPAVLVPYTLLAPAQRQLAIRTSGPLSSVASGVRSAVGALDPLQAVSGVISMEQITRNQMAQPRFVVALFSLFGSIGLMLTMAGVYAVLSYFVSMRAREIGIRMAMGARPIDILRLVGTTGAKLLTVGLAIGTVAAVGVSRLISTQLALFGIDGADPWMHFSIALLLAATGAIACLIPARVAAKIAPLESMR